ncbi:GATA type zinc finger protein, partial [Lachnellula willkommii]
DGRHSLPALEPISRPSSTSTQSSLHHSASLPQLPGMSALVSVASNSPQMRQANIWTNRPFNVPPPTMPSYSASSPSATSGGGQNNSLTTAQMMANNDRETQQPTCQNCTTSTTPLWRRDEIGSVLCNACGLFLKLHGRPRPISLKTDVIKSRNRVKSSSGSGQATKKKLFDNNGISFEPARSQAGTPPGVRRASQKSANGHSDGSNSPVSRTATPSMYPTHLTTFNGHNGHSIEDPYNNHQSPSLPPMHIRQPSPGRSASPLNGGQLEPPQTHEQLIASNAALKTRVSELEVINGFFEGRVTQLEQDEANARRGEEMRREGEFGALQRLEESQRRENQLKRRLDDVERELNERTRELNDLREGEPPAKKMRVADMVGNSESSTPQSVT